MKPIGPVVPKVHIPVPQEEGIYAPEERVDGFGRERARFVRVNHVNKTRPLASKCVQKRPRYGPNIPPLERLQRGH